jgi:hypothetical protein
MLREVQGQLRDLSVWFCRVDLGVADLRCEWFVSGIYTGSGHKSGV